MPTGIKRMNGTPHSRGFTLLEVAVASGLLVLLLATAFGALSQSQATLGIQTTASSMNRRAREVLDQLTRDFRNARGNRLAIEGDLSYNTADSNPPRLVGRPITGAIETVQLIVPVVNTATGHAFDPDGDLTWGNLVTYYTEPFPGEDVTNNLDDNGNGLVDESWLRRRVEEPLVFDPVDPDPLNDDHWKKILTTTLASKVGKDGFIVKYPYGDDPTNPDLSKNVYEITLVLEQFDRWTEKVTGSETLDELRAKAIRGTVTTTVALRNGP